MGQTAVPPPAGTVPSAKVSFEVNGQPHALDVDTRTTLLDALRENLQLTGTKKGCDHGQCGACTVIVDGRRINSCLTLAVMHEARRSRRSKGSAHPGRLHPLQAAFVKHDGYQCGYCTPGQICSAVGVLDEVRRGIPSHVSADLTAVPPHGRGAARAHERQHLPLRRLFEHRRCDHRGRREPHMKPFTYERARTPADAAAAVARNPNSKFIAGGTNLLDLMKLQIETPAHLVDVNGLALDKIEPTPTAGCASARWCATPTSPPTSACGATTACCRARCWPAPRVSCATRRRPPATCCNGRAAPTSTTPTSRATSAGRAPAAVRSRLQPAARGGRLERPPASRRIPSDMAVAMRVLDANVETIKPDGRARVIPIADFHRLPGDTPQIETALERDELITAGDLAAADRRHARLPQGARPRVVCVRADLGRRDRAARRLGPHRARRRRTQAVAHRGGRGTAAARSEGRRRASCSRTPGRPRKTPSSCRWSSARSARC
jgi:aerobic-type carbon monoxide dehydrogenase small subunit (CoxS/CutS family)